MKKTIFSIVISIALAACNSNGDQNASVEKEIAEQKAKPVLTPPQLYEKKWELSQLNGKPIVLHNTFQRYPHLTFQKEGRISGNLGCNGFGGEVELKAGNKIRIFDIASTEMACPNLEVEQGFLAAIYEASNYLLENNTLTLSNDKNEVIIKLVAIAK